MKEMSIKQTFCHCIPLITTLFCFALFIEIAFVITNDRKEIMLRAKRLQVNCQTLKKPRGAETLPRGIISPSSDLKLHHYWDDLDRKDAAAVSKNLLAMPVGIKQKEMVDKIVRKFVWSKFTVMLFHYDGVVEQWRDLDWSAGAIHISAADQTKWWFAKRFLHPDIVSEYDYIFLWDEDLELDHFHPDRYLSIIKEEGLHISQPALDPSKSEVHHRITARSSSTKVHRRIYEFTGGTRCDENSTSPPCTGWVEMMAPVFSRAAWRCVWHMIQNDLVYAWGLDYNLGYCAQGDPTENVGVVDAEYIVHRGIPLLGDLDQKPVDSEASKRVSRPSASNDSCSDDRCCSDNRCQVRLRALNELNIFRGRLRSAAEDDKCWKDPYIEKWLRLRGIGGRRRLQ